ncbi:MAG: hypothetical protein QHH26_02455 [Armatimonadota bacterium]|nr:hypothetical protein [Armatimonadota bacterium]
MRKYLPTITRLPKGEISHRQFFFSEKLLASAFGVRHVYAPVKKVECQIESPGPNFENIMLCDPIPIEDGTYRTYGMTNIMGQSGMRIGVWESLNAFHWTPKLLGQVEIDGHDTNLICFEGIRDQTFLTHPKVLQLPDGRWRMYFWKHREGHLRYLIAESEDGLRWRVPNIEKPVLYHPHDGGLWKLAEGLSPEKMIEISLPQSEVLARKRLWTNDSTHVYFNDQLGRFECYSVWLHPAIPDRRVDVDNAPGVHRLIHRRLSEDGINWSNPELILMPDDRDPWDLQFYFLAVQWHEDLMIGMLGYYRVEDGQQTMDTDLCFSRDGSYWERPVRGGWIPRSEEGSGAMDTKGIYAANSWVDLGNQWLVLYFGTPDPHNAKVHRVKTMGSCFAKNRFVGLSAGRTLGGFITDPLFPSREEICVDANIRGWLKAELCDAFGRKLPGFHLNDSIPVQGDCEEHILRWKNASIADHRYECVRLRFEFVDGEIYGVNF